MNAMLHACTGVGGFAIRQPLAAMAAPPRRRAEAAAWVFAHNPLLAAAAPTLILIDQARRMPHGDVEHAHGAISAALHAFIATVTDSGETASCIQCVAYGLAATAADAVLDTKWGRQSNLGQRSMVTVMFGDAWGGERFFTLLEQMLLAGERHAREIELYHVCLQSGFRGRCRLAPDGPALHASYVRRARAIVMQVRGPAPGGVAPRWRRRSAPGCWR